jgi:hypothetical protein
VHHRAGGALEQTHNLVVGTAGVVCPCCLLHNVARDSLKVHQVVALFEDGHALDALLPLLLFGVEFLGLVLDCRHVDLAQVLRLVQVLVERVGRVDGLVDLGGVLAGILEDDLGAARMFGQEVGDIVGTAMDNDPARVAVVVRGNLLAGELVLLRVVAVAIHAGQDGRGRDRYRRGNVQ